MDSTSEFVYTPLADPLSEIRLLRFLRYDGSLEFEIGHYNLIEFGTTSKLNEEHTENTSTYIAMSYTWGSAEKTHCIMLNGELFKVGANCHYALSQAVKLEQYPATHQHYWMDQICIDQGALKEKGKQVSNMGEVYRRATAVFACIGRHADDSKFVFDLVNSLDLNDFIAVPSFPDVERFEILQRVIERQGIDDPKFERTFRSLSSLAERPYWDRLWIAQELYLSRLTIVLCGADSVLLSSLAEVWSSIIWFETPEHEDPTLLSAPLESHDAMPMTMGYVHDPPEAWAAGVPLGDAVALSQHLHCFDRRDALYGLRAMVHWPDSVDPPQPDYTVSTTGLFWTFVPYVTRHDDYHPDRTMLCEDANLALIRDTLAVNDDSVHLLGKDMHRCQTLWRALHGANSRMEATTLSKLLEHLKDTLNTRRQDWLHSASSKTAIPDQDDIQISRGTLHRHDFAFLPLEGDILETTNVVPEKLRPMHH